jgi:M6 family metalloprotease-like protein
MSLSISVRGLARRVLSARLSLLFPAACLIVAASPVSARPVAEARAHAAVVDGQVEVRVEDYADHSVTRRYLKTAYGTVELQLDDETAVPEAGSIVRVTGEQTGASIVASGTNSVTTLAAAPSALTLGAQSTLVILVNFTDNTAQPWTPSDVRNTVFGDASNFYLENSFGQAWLTGDVTGWYTLPMASTCVVQDIATAARQAATASGVNLAAYKHLVYAYPPNSVCGMSGQSTIGGNPSDTWINGDMSLHTVAHELGHTFGLYHSHALDCGATVIGTNCSVAEYGDHYDTMGLNGNSHFNAFQKERLGWLGYGSSPAIATVQASGTYTIEPYETVSGGGAKALKILQSTDATTGANTWYYLEFRQALGFDSGLTNIAGGNWTNGVIVHLGTDNDGRTSDVLNMTPQSDPYLDWNDIALVAGKTYTDVAAGVTIAPLSANASGITVSVTLTNPAPPPPPPPVCTHANPTVTLTGSGSAVAAGSMLSYTLSVTNNDSSACAASTFTLGASVTKGWTSSFGANTLSIAPGTTMKTMLSVTSPTTASAGTYSVGAAATSGSYSAGATSTYVVAASKSKGGRGK